MTGAEWWRPEIFAAKQQNLRKRAKIKSAIRHFFEDELFIEVDTPCLQVSPGLEPHIMALSTELTEPLTNVKRRFYLHTSPEFAMKKLLTAGMTRIYQFAHVWRDAERSVLHNPEFTMLEWYRAHQSYEQLMVDCRSLLARVCKAAGVSCLSRGERRCDPHCPPKRLSVPEAFFQYCDIDLLATAPNPAAPERNLLAMEAKRIGLFVSDNDSWEDIFFRIMLERIEPHLGDEVPLILYDYPVSLAALARPNPKDPRLAERFELYVCGVELANAFGELTDAAEQRRRFQADMDLKERLYGVRYPIDEDFLAALSFGMPECCGIALGFDRLAMLVSGAEKLEDVLWAPLSAGT